jgi:hypothetical protein
MASDVYRHPLVLAGTHSEDTGCRVDVGELSDHIAQALAA